MPQTTLILKNACIYLSSQNLSVFRAICQLIQNFFQFLSSHSCHILTSPACKNLICMVVMMVVAATSTAFTMLMVMIVIVVSMVVMVMAAATLFAVLMMVIVMAMIMGVIPRLFQQILHHIILFLNNLKQLRT